MGATENAGFNAKVRRNLGLDLGLDFFTKQHTFIAKTSTSLQLSVLEMVTRVVDYRDDKGSRPMWPRGQIIRPRLQARPHSFWPRP